LRGYLIYFNLFSGAGRKRFLKKNIESWVGQKKSEVMGKTEKPLKEKD